MNEIDDNGLVELVRGTVVQAERDAKRGDADAGDFLEWLRGQQAELDAAYARIDERIARMNGETPAPRPQAKPEPAPSPFEHMTAEQLDALGLSTQWAGMTAHQLAELDRKQAHRDRASALGVDWRYLPQED